MIQRRKKRGKENEPSKEVMGKKWRQEKNEDMEKKE